MHLFPGFRIFRLSTQSKHTGSNLFSTLRIIIPQHYCFHPVGCHVDKTKRKIPISSDVLLVFSLVSYGPTVPGPAIAEVN